MSQQDFIQRPVYLDCLKAWREKPVIKVVSGVRRCGKSTLFRLFIDHLLESGVKPEQIVSVNLEELEYEHLLEYRALYDFIKTRLNPDGFTYVFIDEVQQCKDFEKAVDSLFVKDNVDLYITGSNAYMLSGELATLLSGRYVQVEMLPLSFAECMSNAKIHTHNESTAFADYLHNGGFPVVTEIKDVVAPKNADNYITSLLDGIFRTILTKDIAARLETSNYIVLWNIAKFLFSNVGSPVSVKKITDTIHSSGRTISINTVDKYLHALCDSYLFYRVDRYDIRGRQLLKTQCKYYAVDSGLRENILASSSSDIGHVLENIVYLELIRRGYKVSIGKLAEKEVDFVAEDANGLTYFQVSASVLDENTRMRELEPLQRIPDHHPKILLTMDDIPRSANYDGIRQFHVIDWLLGRVDIS